MLRVLKKSKIGFHFWNLKFPVKKNRGLKLLCRMGCICSKGSTDDDDNKVKNERELKKTSKRLVSSSSRNEEVVVEIDNGGNDATARLISGEHAVRSAGSTPSAWDEGNKKPMVFEKPEMAKIQRRATMEVGTRGGQPQMCRVLSVKNGIDGTQIVAGWPSWLTAVAGEAIKGWIPRKADSFEKLDKIGQGTYSSVYRARDLETEKIVALKKVRFVNMDPDSVRFMAREILILRRLDHPNIMKLEGLVTSRVSGNLYLVFEYMEHDLTGLLASPTVKFTEPQIKCYMQQLLRGLEHCHSRGVLHRDIKGSNLLIDNNGVLKIGDFGLATFFRANQKQPLTSRVVTLWYRPPELLLGATNYGVSVDLWSSGCILAELFSGKSIMTGRTEVEQLHKIFKLCGSPSEEYWKTSKLPHVTIFKPQHPYKRCVNETFKDFPPSALALVESLLAFEPECRGSTTSALQSEFFTTKPLPCDPSSLPKYPPCKEFDAKMRDEARRQKAACRKGGGLESSRKTSKESKAIPPSDPNAEMQASIQARKGQSNPKSTSDKYDSEDSVSGFRIEPSRGSSNRGHATQRGTSGNLLDSCKPQDTAARLSRFSNSVAARGNSQLDFSRDSSAHSHWPEHRLNTRYERINDAESSHHLHERPYLSNKNNGAMPRKETSTSYALKKTRMHYSGPLLLPGGSVEDMLKEHERQIQHAVRKARMDKNKTKGYGDYEQTDSLLEYVNNGR
ncbi:probable serine/threonine-protein kinase At1g09600 isoform X1 [Primulina eburnea]|uniref:probable serine/threonine-protein kinase At1g09600 isoform X1 n=1 Tax=Primulina eburnea TaxID=1245227 RepID=UPI003C6BDC2F